MKPQFIVITWKITTDKDGRNWLSDRAVGPFKNHEAADSYAKKVSKNNMAIVMELEGIR